MRYKLAIEKHIYFAEDLNQLLLLARLLIDAKKHKSTSFAVIYDRTEEYKCYMPIMTGDFLAVSLGYNNVE